MLGAAAVADGGREAGLSRHARRRDDSSSQAPGVCRHHLKWRTFRRCGASGSVEPHVALHRVGKMSLQGRLGVDGAATATRFDDGEVLA